MGISLGSVLQQQKNPVASGAVTAHGGSALMQVPPSKAVSLSENAARQARAIMAREGHQTEHVWLRLGVKGGGCSGLSYVIDVAQKKDVFDVEFVSQGIRLLVDKKSLLYVGGMQLDFGQGLKAGWQFNNPNQKKGCSCGESFSV